ncbi:MAG TPA: DUF4326 domain-containing protein [Candidatus Limnocylindrales bacterium]
MTAPRRLPVVGDYYHGAVPTGAIYVGRPAPGIRGSIFANPYPVKRHGLAESRRLFLERLVRLPSYVERAREDLAGRDLCCWCKPDALWCHADDWIAIANGVSTASALLRAGASNHSKVPFAGQQTDGNEMPLCHRVPGGATP